jgi:uncharacterized protein (UPF0332 family)
LQSTGRNWRIEKAERFLAAAQAAFEQDDGETVASKCYYAVYHDLIALLEAKANLRRARWDHRQLQADFRTQFARRGYLFSMRDAEELQRLYDARVEADYQESRISLVGAERLLKQAQRLHGEVLRVLSDV